MKCNPSHCNLLIVALLSLALAGCTLIRYGDENDSPGGNNDNQVDGENLGEVPFFNDIPADATQVDVLLMVDLARGGTHIMNGYTHFLNLLEMELSTRGVYLRNRAVAPLYRQLSQRPALLFGEGDPDNLYPHLGDVLHYYVSDEGLGYLDSRVDTPGENLAALGANLDLESIYNPERVSEESRAYFNEAADGFVVFHLTGSARQCDHDAHECLLNERTAAHYFTETNEETGHADWLSLPNASGLAPENILHVTVATRESVDQDAFEEHCNSQPNFPQSHIDLLEPSTEHAYFGPFVEGLKAKGGAGINIDLCTALSRNVDSSAAMAASQIIEITR